MIQLNKNMRMGIKIAFAVTSFLAAGAFFWQGQNKGRSIWQTITAPFNRTPTPPKHRLSFHLPADIAALQVLINAAIQFCETKGVHLDVKKFYHNQDTALLKGQVEESLAWEAEAIITIGNMSAQNTHAVLTKRESKTPHLFACVADPRVLGISTDQYYTGTTSTGIAEDSSGANDAFIRSVRHVRPDAKKALVFYSNASPTLPSIAAGVMDALEKNNIKTEGVLARNLEELAQLTQSRINRDIDVVVILRDALIVSGLQAVIKACRIHGVTAFASDSNSVRNGAVAGCCIEEGEIGLLLGELIIKVIADKVSAQEIPVTYFNTALLCHTYINPFEMNAQGLHGRGIYDLMKGELKLEFVH